MLNLYIFWFKNKIDIIDTEFRQYRRHMVDKLNSLGLGSKSVKNKNKKKKEKCYKRRR